MKRKMLVKRIRLTIFLVDTCINNPSGLRAPTVLIQKVSMYPSMGQVVYNRNPSVECPPFKYVNVTVLQLIFSGLVRMEIDKERRYTLRLVVNSLSPSYLDNSIWNELYTFDDDDLTVGTADA